MSLRLTNSFINTSVPGSYFSQQVRSTPVGVAISGNILLIGESEGGASFSDESSLKDNFFGPDQISQIQAKYISGPIVDAANALAAPSLDADISGSVSKIYVLKTNSSSKAEAIVAAGYGTLQDKNYGLKGNNFFYQITQIESEVRPSITSDVIDMSDPTVFNGLSFTVRQNGGAAVVITLSAISANHDTFAELVSEIGSFLPVGFECVAGAATNTLIIRLTSLSDNAANALGHGRSFELIDSSIGDLAAIGLDEQVVVSSQEPIIQLAINRNEDNVNETFIINSDVALKIGYEGTTASLSINNTTKILSTTVVGGSGSNLSIKITDYQTIKDLADYINTQTGYSCSINAEYTQSSPDSLDKVSAIGICTSIADEVPGRIKTAASNFEEKANQSYSLDYTRTLNLGLPNVMSNVAYLAGGAKGASTSSDITDALSAAEGLVINFVVPLFSRNASSDISEGLTDSGSTYTIDAIHAAVKTHVAKMSTSRIKKHRQAFLSYDGTFAEAKNKASSIASSRFTLSFQRANQGGVEHLPWYVATLAAGMQAAGFYKPIFNKVLNLTSFIDPSGYDSGSISDQEEAIEAGLLSLSQDFSGNKIISDQTTYAYDNNFVYNSIQAVYAADLVSLDLADSIQRNFIGKSLADVDISSVKSFLIGKFEGYRSNKLVTGDDSLPSGYKEKEVRFSAPSLILSLEIKLATGIYFAPISLEFSNVNRS